MTVPLATIADAIAAGLRDYASLWQAATATMRCRAHDLPMIALDSRGALCERCAAERYGREGRHTPPATQQLSRPDVSVAAPDER